MHCHKMLAGCYGRNNIAFERFFASAYQGFASLKSPIKHLNPKIILEPKIQLMSSQRLASKFARNDLNLPRGDHDGFKLFFRCPVATLVAALSRIKIYQTAFLLLGSPTCYVLYSMGTLEWSAVPAFTTAASIATLTLFYFTHVTRRMIGLMFLNEEHALVKIAYVNFWARREDITVPVQSIQLLDDVRVNYAKKPLVKIHLTDPTQYFFTSLRFGQVYDFEMFGKVLGRKAAYQFKCHANDVKAKHKKQGK